MSPRNVLVLGNSHTAAPRIALRDNPGRWPGFAPDVFAMPGHTIAELDLQGDDERAEKDRGRPRHRQELPDQRHDRGLRPA